MLLIQVGSSLIHKQCLEINLALGNCNCWIPYPAFSNKREPIFQTFIIKNV